MTPHECVLLRKGIRTKRVKYGIVIKAHCQYIYTIEVHCPNNTIYLYNDNVLGKFPKQAFNPRIAKVNVSIDKGIMILPVVLYSRENFGPGKGN